MRFVVLTSRDPKTDFRTPLVHILRQSNRTAQIWIKRHPVISDPVETQTSVLGLLRFFWRLRRENAPIVYLNSTSTSFPCFTLLLRLIGPRGLWCLDMHDDLLYDNTGLSRIRAWFAVSVMRAFSDTVICAAPTLTELFPEAKHLGNASHMRPSTRSAGPVTDILVLASVDHRFDFEFLSRVAELRPDLQFHLHGAANDKDTALRQQLAGLRERHCNVHLHGSYTLDELPAILSRYSVTVAPFRTGIRLTRYIDPLRFYHCLNAGLEVITTDIPQARALGAFVTIVHDPGECAAMLTAALSGRLAKRASYSPITWEQRKDRLMEIVRDALEPGSRRETLLRRAGE